MKKLAIGNDHTAVEMKKELKAYLEEKGYAMDPSTARYEADGKTLMLIYLKEEMNGFAIHLTTRK